MQPVIQSRCSPDYKKDTESTHSLQINVVFALYGRCSDTTLFPTLCDVSDSLVLFDDFYNFYAAGELIHSGGNPFVAQQIRDARVAAGFPADRVLPPFPYPVWSMWLFFLLALGSFDVTVAMISIAACTTFYLYVLRVARQIDERPEWLTDLVVVMLAISFSPVIKVILFGQISWVPLLGILFGASALSRGKPLQAGAWLSLIMIKPHLFIGVFGFIAARALWFKHRRLLWGFVIGFVAQLTVSYAVFPFGWAQLLGYVMQSPHGVQAELFMTTSVTGVLGHYSGTLLPQVVGVVTAFVLGVVVAVRGERHNADTLFFKSLLPVSLFLAPYAWLHDYVIIFPLVLEVVMRICRYHERCVLLLWVLLTMVVYVLLLARYEHYLFGVYGLVLLSMIRWHCWALSPNVPPEKGPLLRV